MKRGKFKSIPPVSDYASRGAWEAACWKRLLTSRAPLDLLATASERRDLVLRAAALDRLHAGKSYRAIGDELWLSPQTISGIKKAFKENGYRSYLVRSKTERKKKQYALLHHPTSKSRHRSARTEYGTIQRI